MDLRLRKSCFTLSVLILLLSGSILPIAVAQTGSWSRLNGPYRGNVTALVVDRQGYIYAATQFNGVYRSTDGGGNWTPVNNGLDWENLTALAVDSSGIVYAGGIFSGLFRTTDHGESWNRTGLPGGAACVRVLSGGRVFAGGLDTVSISTDQGKTWTSSMVSVWSVQVLSLAEDKLGNIYAGLQSVHPHHTPPYGGGVYLSTDGGAKWKYDGQGLVTITAIQTGNSGGMFLSNGFTILSASPGDTNWVQNAIGLPHSTVAALTNSSSGGVVAAVGGGLYVYNEAGHAWDVVLGRGLSSTSVTSFYYDTGGTSYAGTSRNGVFRMTDPDTGWLQCGLLNAPVRAVGCGKTGQLYVGTDDGVYEPAAQAGMWLRASDGLLGGTVNAFDTVSFEPGIYASTSAGIFYSGDVGGSWVIESARAAYDLTEGSSGVLYAGTTAGVQVSAPDLANWTSMADIGFPVSTVYSVLWSNGWLLFAGTSNNGVFMSTDRGNFWSQTGISSPLMFCSVRALAQENTILSTDSATYPMSGAIFAGTDTAGAFYTEDSGDSWTHISSITAKDVSCFLLISSVVKSGSPLVKRPLFAGTMDRGVFVSTDGGANWRAMNDGLADSSVASLAMSSDGYLYAATDSGVYRTTEIVTAVASKPKRLPLTPSLKRNYPNPFNPTTMISYLLPMSSRVTLRVYDVLGREVRTLVSRTENPGSHIVTFDGSRLASGVYFYRLVVVPLSGQGVAATPFIQTKKMVLVK